MEPKFRGFFVIALIAFLPLAQATPSGLTYLDSTWSSIEGEGGELLALNPNGTILASYHGKEIILFNTTTLEKIGGFEFDEEVIAMEFNPNGSILAINKRSNVQLKESIRLIDIESMEVLENSVLVDDRFRDISWSVDGTLLAAHGNDGDGDVEQYHVPDLDLKNTLLGIHVVDITCIDYRSDGQYVLTGDESGRWAVWNLQGELQNNYFTYSEGIIDCKFSPDGNDVVLLGDKGKFTSKIFGGQERYNESIKGAKEILFSKVINRMYISVESDDFRGLMSYDYNSLSKLTNTTFFHRVEDVAFTERDNGRIDSLFVAGGTGEIAVYIRELYRDGYNQPGVDLDGDLIPDDLDDDDDGDGIMDDWDDDIGCDAPDEIPCSRYPDLSKIRSIEIFIDDNFVITDRITLPTEESSHIRNLSRNAVAKDNVISSSEVDLFADAMCKNMNHDDIIEKWKEAIVLSNGELGDGVVTCEISSGMQLIRDGDSTTQISITITTTLTYATPVSLPLEISLIEQPLPTEGSIAWLAPAHPISLKFGGNEVEEEEIPLWWNDETNYASVTINQVSVKNPSFLENVITWALHPFAFVLYLGIVIFLITGLIRWSNRIDFDDEDDDIENESNFENDDAEDEDLLSDEDISRNSSTNIPEEKLEEKKTAHTRTMEDNPANDRKPAKKRKMYSTSANQNQSLTKKRKVSTSQLNKDGPIMKTKRKRLVAEEPKNLIPSDDSKAEQNAPPIKVKKRKVKIEPPKIEPEKKKRKAVKRKSKTTNQGTESEKSTDNESKKNDEKVIDEKELQNNLISDFTSE